MGINPNYLVVQFIADGPYPIPFFLCRRELKIPLTQFCIILQKAIRKSLLFYANLHIHLYRLHIPMQRKNLKQKWIYLDGIYTNADAFFFTSHFLYSRTYICLYHHRHIMPFKNEWYVIEKAATNEDKRENEEKKRYFYIGIRM